MLVKTWLAALLPSRTAAEQLLRAAAEVLHESPSSARTIELYQEARESSPLAYIDAFNQIFTKDDWTAFFDELCEDADGQHDTVTMTAMPPDVQLDTPLSKYLKMR